VPFQCSMSGRTWVPLRGKPTAQMSLAETTRTAVSLFA
jgi:hypothetical protein